VAHEEGRVRLVRFAYALTGDIGHAEDVVQTALIKTYLATRRRMPESPEAHVRRAIVTANISRFRRRRVVEHLVDVVPDHVAAMDNDHLHGSQTAMEELLGRLTKRQRTVLVLRYREDWSEAEIAAAMRVAPGTVKTLAPERLPRYGRPRRPRRGARHDGRRPDPLRRQWCHPAERGASSPTRCGLGDPSPGQSPASPDHCAGCCRAAGCWSTRSAAFRRRRVRRTAHHRAGCTSHAFGVSEPGSAVPGRVCPLSIKRVSDLASSPALAPEGTVTSGATLLVTLTPQDATKLARLSGRQVGRQLALVVQDTVYSAPQIAERLNGGMFQLQLSESAADAFVTAVIK